MFEEVLLGAVELWQENPPSSDLGQIVPGFEATQPSYQSLLGTVLHFLSEETAEEVRDMVAACSLPYDSMIGVLVCSYPSPRYWASAAI